MSVKGDRTPARTAADIERKYSFGKRFSEILGLIDDTRKDLDSVNSELRNEITEQTTALRRDTESIVLEAKQTTQEVADEVSTLRQEVQMKVTAEDVTIAVKSELENGVESVRTSTGFTFNADGLNISKSGTEMETLISEDGMTVYRNDVEVLKANNQGVEAKNLNASTYLIVGGSSRFENYGATRTGCFWIGG